MPRSGILAVATVLVFGLHAGTAPAAKFFHSPSGNIACGISKQGARCDIREREWRPPPKPRQCDQDWGYGLTLGKQGKGRFFCAGDSLFGLGSRLAYGKSVARGRFRCVSRTDGIRCVNRRNGHGFKLSRERAKRF
jgi:hypothetical protein